MTTFFGFKLTNVGLNKVKYVLLKLYNKHIPSHYRSYLFKNNLTHSLLFLFLHKK